MPKNLSGKRVLITGVGMKPVQTIFKDIDTGLPSHTPVVVEGKEYKANIGAASAMECAKEGAIVHMVARTKENLEKISSWIKTEVPDAIIECSAIDLTQSSEIYQMVEHLPSDLPLYWIQSVGLGAGTVNLKDDNPYLLIDDISSELVEAELTVLKQTISLLQTLLPLFRRQKETRVCIISSMSAIRSVISGSMHMAAKGAISRFTNAAMLELGQQNIFITEIRPGGVDTGLYDSAKVQETVVKIAKTYGYDWSNEHGGLRLMPPSAVGKIIASVLTSEAHTTSVNLVSRGQWPNEGS